MTAVSSRGLYLYAHDFWKEQNAGGLIHQTKQEIVQRYVERFAPQLFKARASAAFGGAAPEAIDNFFKGTNSNDGYISKLQGEIDKYYSDSLRNARELFTSKTNINTILGSGGSINLSDTSSPQVQELGQMLKAQHEILNALSKLSSQYESYVLDKAAEYGYKPPKPLKNGNGLYLKNYSQQGMKDAIKIYNHIQQTITTLKSVQVGSDLSSSFTAFRETADEFHKVYAEYLGLVCSHNVNKGIQRTFKGTPLDAQWSGNKKYLPGAGDISISINHFFDPVFQKTLSIQQELPTRKITATNDVSIVAGDGKIVGTYGETIKEYSDETLTKLNGYTTIASSMGNIYKAASTAVQYGLPSQMADPMWINNLLGAVPLPSEVAAAQLFWSNFKQTVANLLVVDALMGKMLNGIVSSNANNLVYYENGQVYYMGDIIKRCLNNPNGFTGNMFTQNNQWAQDTVRAAAARAHWHNFTSGGSAAQAEALINSYGKSVQLKVSISLNNLLQAAR